MIKCPLCNCFFVNNGDLNSQMETHWRLTKDGEGWLMEAHPSLYLTRLLRTVGTMIKDGYRYALVHDEE